MSIEAILAGKGNHVISVDVADRVRDVIALLAEARIGCVPVLAAGEVKGVFSERDLIYRLAQEGADVLGRPVGEVMTSPAITVTRDTAAISALSLITRRRIRHLPVMEEGALIGLVSIGDLVKYRMDRIESEADAMRAYIQGN